MIQVLAVIILLGAQAAGAAVPQLKGPVNDYAGVMTPAESHALEEKLLAHEKASSDQIVLLVVKSLDGDTIDGYSIKVAEAWKIGQKKKDNGVLIIHSVDDRQMRIETGLGVQDKLTDLVCKRITGDEMKPHFKRAAKGEAGQYAAGYNAAIDKIIATLGVPAQPAPVPNPQGGHISVFWLIVIIAVVLLLILLVIWLLLSARSDEDLAEADDDDRDTSGGYVPVPYVPSGYSGSAHASPSYSSTPSYSTPSYSSPASSDDDDNDSSSGGSSWSSSSSSSSSSEESEPESPSYDGGGGDFDGGGASDSY